MKTINKADQVREAVRERILSGEFGKRGRLPSLRTLATEYKISQETINKVIQVLQAEGWIVSLGQRGIFVNIPRVRLSGLQVSPGRFHREQNPDAVEELLEPVTILQPPVEIAESMGLQQAEMVVRRFRKFFIPNLVYRISEDYFPRSLMSEEMVEKMSDANYEVLPDIRGVSKKFIKYVHEGVLSRFPTQYEQDLLKIVRTNPILDIKRINYTHDKKTVVMFNHIVLNANHFLLSYDYTVSHWG